MAAVEGQDEDQKSEIKDFEDLLRLAGTKNKRNVFNTIMASLVGLVLGVNVFSYQFIGATPGHSCYIKELHNGSNWTFDQIKNLTAPIIVNKDGEEEHSSCSIYNISYSQIDLERGYEGALQRLEEWRTFNNETIPCPKRRFEEGDTVVTEWDLVCDRRYLFTWTQGAVQLGLLFGSIIIGYLIDKYGRKKIYMYCVILFLLSGGISIFSPNVEFYIFLKMIAGGCGLGFYLALFVSAMENCLSSERSLVGCYFIIPWAFGMMVTSGIAKLVTQWQLLQLVFAVPGLVLVANYWIIPESPRWLVMNGYHYKAYEVLKQIAKSNKRSLPDMNIMMDKMKDIQNEQKQESEFSGLSTFERIKALLNRLVVLLAMRKFRIQTLLVFYCWFAAATVYYGVSLGAPGITDDDHLYLFIGGVLELLSYLLLLPIVHYMGRRLALIGFYALCAFCIFGALFFIVFSDTKDYYELKLFLYLVGRFAIISAFQLVWMWTAELYPTKFRSLAVGEASTVGRIGSIFSPFINDLLSEVRIWIPALLFGSLSFLAIFCAFALKETNRQNLNENVKEDSGKDNPGFKSETSNS